MTSVEAGKLSDDYVQARRQVRRTPSDQKEDRGGGGPDKRKCHKCGGEGHFKRYCPVKDEQGADRAGASTGRTRTDKGIKCFNCHRYGHMSMNCPDKANFYCEDRLGRSVVRVGKVEGAVVSEVVLDTGCSRTMVRRDLVPEENLLPGEAVTVLCAHGDAMPYPLAYVDMEVEGMQLRTKAAIAKELPVAALLGTDISQLGELLRMNTQTRSTNTMNHVMVVTRAQAEREKEEAELQRQQTERSAAAARVEGWSKPRKRNEGESERLGARQSESRRSSVGGRAPHRRPIRGPRRVQGSAWRCPPRARALSRGPPRGRARRTPALPTDGGLPSAVASGAEEGRRAGSAAGRVFAAGGELTAVGPARAGPPRREVACFHPSSRSASVRSASASRDCSQCPASACRSERETSHGRCCGGLVNRRLHSTRLQWLDRVKENNGRLTHWSLFLQPYQFTVQYRPGKRNANADTLSSLL